MKNDFKIRWGLRLAIGAAAVLVGTGCAADHSYGVHGEDFIAEDGGHPVNDFIQMQASNSARADATLHAHHFDGMMLNSLGEEHLELILHNGDSISPLTLYLDLPADDHDTARRQQAVLAYLKDRGLTDEQIQFKAGVNPSVNSSAAALLTPATAGGAASGGSAQPTGVTAPAH